MELINNNEMVYENRKIEFNLWYHPDACSYILDLTFTKDNNRVGVRHALSETHVRHAVDFKYMSLCCIDGMVRQLREEYLNQYGSVINIHNGPFKSFVESMQNDILKLKTHRES